jgi:hypothetical protein
MWQTLLRRTLLERLSFLGRVLSVVALLALGLAGCGATVSVAGARGR